MKTDRIATALVSILLFFIGVWRLNVKIIPMRIYLELGFKAIIILALSYLIWKYIGNVWVILFLLLAYVSHINLRCGVFTTIAGERAFNFIFLGIFWYVFIVCFYPHNRLYVIYNIFCIVALCNVCLLRLQTININIFRETSKLWPVGFLTNPNEISALLALLFPAFLRRKWVYFLPLVIYGIYLTKSFIGIAGIVLGGMVYICFTEGLAFIICYTLFCVGVIYLFIRYVDIPGIRVRFGLWRLILVDKLKPFWKMGFNLGEFKNLTKWDTDFFFFKGNDGRVWYKSAHNDFFQALFEMGIGFPIIILGYLLDILKRLFKVVPIIPLVALVVIIVTGFCTYIFHNPVNALYSITWLALLEKELSSAKQLNKRKFLNVG